MSLAVSLPASLLLAGEYIILIEGGLGLAAAPDIRLYASSTPAKSGRLTVLGLFGRERIEWSGTSGPPGLVPTILAFVQKKYLLQDLPPLSITLDSRPFYDSEGRKLGFGSSASAGTALIALLTTEITGSLPPEEELLQTAIDAHRQAQGGKGSGYDVACSLFGGTGLFQGGAAPRWKRLDLAWLESLELRSFAEPVSSSAAVGNFEEFRRQRPKRSDLFFRRNNEILRAFADNPERSAGEELLRKCRELGIELGREIGVNAELPDDNRGSWKASGAGDELGFRLSRADQKNSVPISSEGLRLE